MPYDARRENWTYYGVTVDPITAGDGSGIHWSALVNFPGYAGYLKADTKAGMREAMARDRVARVGWHVYLATRHDRRVTITV